MSLKLSNSSKQMPFFPPGIASHKHLPSSYNSSDFVGKRPQTVKECKTLSKNKRNIISTSFTDYNDHQFRLRRFSNSTPNLKACPIIEKQISSVPRHNCDMGLVDRGYFKASPLPPYYSSESLERNRSLFENGSVRNKTRSLDRLSSVKKSKNLTGFVPERPFYPPSKYPNINDKSNNIIQRLVETRERYKTPESRKLTNQFSRRLSASALEKKNSKRSTPINNNGRFKNTPNFVSTPNLNKKEKPDRRNKSNLEKNSFNDFYGDQLAYTSEIGPYRQSNKLDLLSSDDFNRSSSNDMFTSYFYPKPIPSKRTSITNDRMAQSLIFERSVASMIFTGSLDRANRNDQYMENVDVTDLDDSPTKSVSAPKRPNSFSQDSLDGNKKKLQQSDQHKGDTWLNSGNKSSGFDSEHDKSTTMSQIEEDELKTLCSGNSDLRDRSASNYFMEHLQCKDDLDQYNIDQVTKQNLAIKDISSFTYSGRNSPILVGNEFSCTREHSIIGKDDRTLLNDLASKCIVSTNQNLDHSFADKNLRMTNSSELHRPKNGRTPRSSDRDLGIDRFLVDQSQIHSQGDDSFTMQNSDQTLLDGQGFHKTKGTDPHLDRTFVTSDDNFTETSRLLSNQNEECYAGHKDGVLLRDMPVKHIVGTDQYYDRMSATDDNLTNISQLHGPTNGRYSILKNGNYIPDNSSTKENVDIGNRYDGILARDNYLLQDQTDYNYLRNGLGASDNQCGLEFVKVNGSDYDRTEERHRPKYHSGEVYRNTAIPDIEVEGDADATESSSTNELSWSGYDENKSFRDYGNNSVRVQRTDIPWASSPELHSARYSFVRRPDRHLQSENPLKPLCSSCYKPAYFMERISISNIIFHKSCFRCRKCDTHLNFNNCILHRNRPYCLVHVRPKIWKSVRSASAKKLNQIKERLDNKSNMQRQGSTETKQPKRIFYEGIKSAKTKFLEDATKTKEIQLKDPKRITPPRQGFNSGVIESEPKPRDPNVIAGRDNQTSYYDEMELLTKSTSAKETRDRFKELQYKSFDSKDAINGDANESTLSRRPDVIPVDTKSLKNRFLEAANDSDNKLTKINPSDEIQRLGQQQTNSIYENEPESRIDVIKSNSPREDETTSPISRTRAKEMKDKFSNFNQDDKPKKSQFKLEYGEGGVYESNPQENNDDVVKHNYDTSVFLPENAVKSGLQKIKELQDFKSQGFQKTNKEPIKLDSDPSQSGIYENTPEQSRADSISYLNEGSLLEFRERNYTNDAKKLFSERQKQEEEASTKKSTPHMIDIWKDLCPDSGIFENEPKEQREDVVKYEYRTDELMVHSDNTITNGKEEIHSTNKNDANNIQINE